MKHHSRLLSFNIPPRRAATQGGPVGGKGGPQGDPKGGQEGGQNGGPVGGDGGMPGGPVPPQPAGSLAPVGRQAKARALPALAISLACLATCVGVAQLAASQPRATSVGAAACPLQAEHFFVRESLVPEGRVPEGRIEASYFVLLRNPEPQARAYGLHFDHPAAFDARAGMRATVPGFAALPVLLGREILPAGTQPLPPARIAGATRLSCRG